MPGILVDYVKLAAAHSSAATSKEFMIRHVLDMKGHTFVTLPRYVQAQCTVNDEGFMIIVTAKQVL